jgi:hypothetical protein
LPLDHCHLQGLDRIGLSGECLDCVFECESHLAVCDAVAGVYHPGDAPTHIAIQARAGENQVVANRGSCLDGKVDYDLVGRGEREGSGAW